MSEVDDIIKKVLTDYKEAWDELANKEIGMKTSDFLQLSEYKLVMLLMVMTHPEYLDNPLDKALLFFGGLVLYFFGKTIWENC